MEERFEQSDLKEAIKTILEGGIILFKDEVGWHYGCSSVEESAILKLLSLNKSPFNYELITDNENKIDFFAEYINDLVYEIIDLNDNPTTIILKHKKNVHLKIINSYEVGFRKSKNLLLSYLCYRLKQPLFTVLINNSAYNYDNLIQSSDFDENFADYIIAFNSNNSNAIFSKRDILKIEEDGTFEIINN